MSERTLIQKSLRRFAGSLGLMSAFACAQFSASADSEQWSTEHWVPVELSFVAEQDVDRPY